MSDDYYLLQYCPIPDLKHDRAKASSGHQAILLLKLFRDKDELVEHLTSFCLSTLASIICLRKGLNVFIIWFLDFVNAIILHLSYYQLIILSLSLHLILCQSPGKVKPCTLVIHDTPHNSDKVTEFWNNIVTLHLIRQKSSDIDNWLTAQQDVSRDQFLHGLPIENKTSSKD